MYRTFDDGCRNPRDDRDTHLTLQSGAPRARKPSIPPPAEPPPFKVSELAVFALALNDEPLDVHEVTEWTMRIFRYYRNVRATGILKRFSGGREAGRSTAS